MLPISALRTPLAADLQTAISQGLGAATKAIPAQEMEKLPTVTPLATPGVSQTGGGSFSNVLGQFVNEVNTKQAAAGDAVTGLLSGGNVSLHQAMIAMEEANVSFQLMIEVRNKLLDSYQELMRMQV
jgi:flagellar hook-basal body complex protein FliE